MVLGIAVDRIASIDQSRDHADVGRVTGGEQKRRLTPFELRKPLLELNVRRATTGNQRARSPANARPTGFLHRRFDQPAVGGQVQIVVR